MLYVDNKFEIGQEVYIVQKAREDFICPACNGDGHKMIDSYIKSINDKTKRKRDCMIHVGDFYHKGKSHYMEGDIELGYKVEDLLDRINCNVILLQGNHDINNTGFCHGRWMTLNLDKTVEAVLPVVV